MKTETIVKGRPNRSPFHRLFAIVAILSIIVLAVSQCISQSPTQVLDFNNYEVKTMEMETSVSSHSLATLQGSDLLDFISNFGLQGENDFDYNLNQIVDASDLMTLLSMKVDTIPQPDYVLFNSMTTYSGQLEFISEFGGEIIYMNEVIQVDEGQAMYVTNVTTEGGVTLGDEFSIIVLISDGWVKLDYKQL